MIQIPANMQPTLDRWKQNHSLGEGTKFGSFSRPSQYEQLMDTVVASDNGPGDSHPEKGLLVAKDDGETIRFQGNSQKGSMEAATADGRVVALNFDEQSVDFLQLSAKSNGVEALHEHFDRQTGQGWMQVGGAVTVINMDEPGALEQIFAPKTAAPTAAVNPELAAQAAAIGQSLASKLQVSPDQLQLASCETKGFNASNCGFAVQGEMQMSAWTEGLEAHFECEGQKYLFRGLDAANGRYAQDVNHDGYWKQDERGIYVPDNSAAPDLW